MALIGIAIACIYMCRTGPDLFSKQATEPQMPPREKSHKGD